MATKFAEVDASLMAAPHSRGGCISSVLCMCSLVLKYLERCYMWCLQNVLYRMLSQSAIRNLVSDYGRSVRFTYNPIHAFAVFSLKGLAKLKLTIVNFTLLKCVSCKIL